uniref:Uncharacterized protein n=1 Tax=Caenorhabditis tropicalis TaxID=1561998 RepID=A0A1I7V4J7_9PELO
KETERIRLENLEKFNLAISAFWKCLEMKLNWEMIENNWEESLKGLRSLVSQTKIQFSRLKDSMRFCENFDRDDVEYLKEELEILHSSTLSTFEVLYSSYFKIKELSERNEDRTFLFILRKQLSLMCNTFSLILQNIDSLPVDENLLGVLRNSFDKLDSSDILSTSQLKSLSISGNSEDYKNIEDPSKYEPKNNVLVEDISDETEEVEKKTQSTIGRQDAQKENSDGVTSSITDEAVETIPHGDTTVLESNENVESLNNREEEEGEEGEVKNRIVEQKNVES